MMTAPSTSGTLTTTTSSTSTSTPSADAALLKRLVRTLDRSDRLLLMLHYADGLSEPEISIILNQPVLAIMEKLRELRNKVAMMLGVEPTVALG